MLAIDLCAGSGWAVACRWLGISELGIEIMPEAIATRDAMGVYTQDISIADLPDTFCRQAPLQIAGPPCQTFSAAGNGEGRAALAEVLRRVDHFGRTGELIRGGTGDARTWLVLEPLRLAMHGLPEYIVWEQVPSVLPVWRACDVVLRSVGYSVWTGLIHAEQYGVPQTRKRAILIARRDGKIAATPPVTHSRYYNRTPERIDPGVLPWVSMAQALGWGGAEMRSNYGTGGDPSARGIRPMTSPAPTLTSKIDRNKWVYANENRAERPVNRPAPTIHFGARTNLVTWEPDHVQVTVIEAAVLQTFPADHPFAGTKGKQYLQIGNAVPPLLGWHILSTFL